MVKFTDIAYLCGYFSCEARLANCTDALEAVGWTRHLYDVKEVEVYNRYYYPEFVDFWLGNEHEHPVTTFTRDTDESLTVDATCSVILKGIRLCMMPFGMVLYAAEVHLAGDDLNAFTLILSRLRGNLDFMSKRLQEAISALGCEENKLMMESGNKLKIFQIVKCNTPKSVIMVSDDATLFQLGSLSRVAPYNPEDPQEISHKYLEEIIRNHKLSFYNNWTALALFDTFTILAHDVPDWMVDNWRDDYFGKIYMHCLFCKFYLYRQNGRFRMHPAEGERIGEELAEFERRYSFQRISYNFMPGEIDHAIDRALDLSPELQMLHSYISTCNEQREKALNCRLNALLTLLTVLTVASTLWDFSSMVNALYPFNDGFGSEPQGFRTVVSLAILLIILAVLRIMWPRRK